MSEEKKSKKQEFIDKALADPDLKGFSKEKKLQLFALKISYGNKTKAAKMLGLERSIFYYHCNNDPKYKVKVEEIDDMCIDIVEDKLMENIDNNDTTAIIFFLKTRASARGYVEQAKVDHTTKGKELPAAPQPVMFIPADQLTPEQIQAYLKNGAGTGNESIS